MKQTSEQPPSGNGQTASDNTPDEMVFLILEVTRLAQEAHGGNVASLQSILSILDAGIDALNNFSSTPHEIIQTAAAERTSWPALVGCHPHQKRETTELIKQLNLSSKSTPKMRLAKGQKRPWDTQAPANRIALQLFAEISEMRKFHFLHSSTVERETEPMKAEREVAKRLVESGEFTSLQGDILETLHDRQEIAIRLPNLSKSSAGKWGYAAFRWIQLQKNESKLWLEWKPNSLKAAHMREQDCRLEVWRRVLVQKKPIDPDKAIQNRLTQAFESLAQADEVFPYRS